ncbi:hypothetical protein SLA2020_420170 [Shorea laevis]
MMLETVAAFPGMVGGMLLHCKSLRRFGHSGDWIKALLEEGENERYMISPKFAHRVVGYLEEEAIHSADEAHHRDVNHFASNKHYQGRELRESPAPLGYH